MTAEKLNKKIKELQNEIKTLKENDKTELLENEVNRLNQLLHETLVSYGNLIKMLSITNDSHVNFHTSIFQKLKK